MRAKPYFFTVSVRTEEESGLVGDDIFVPLRPGLVRTLGTTCINQSVVALALTTIKDFRDNQSGRSGIVSFHQ